MSISRSAAFAAALIVAMAGPAVRAAEAPIAPDDEIYTPLVEPGEVELEARAYHLDGNGAGENHTSDFRFEAAYSPTAFWRVSAEPVLIAPPHAETRVAEVQFENVFQLAPANDVVNVGLLVDYDLATLHGADDEIEAGPIFEKQMGAFTATGEVFGERGLGDEGDYGLNYGWRLAWRTSDSLQLAVQGFGEREFEDDEDDEAEAAEPEDTDFAPEPDDEGLPGYPTFGTGDRLGPAIIGRLPWLDDADEAGDGLSYQLGVLFGLDHGAADHTLRLSFEYEL